MQSCTGAHKCNHKTGAFLGPFEIPEVFKSNCSFHTHNLRLNQASPLLGHALVDSLGPPHASPRPPEQLCGGLLVQKPE